MSTVTINDKTPVNYKENFVVDPGQAFMELWADPHWIDDENVPRRELYCNDHAVPYTYGKGVGERTYYPTPWNPVMSAIREKIKAEYLIDYDVCFVNGYRNGKDQLGWHADDSPEMDDAFPIMIVSLYPDDKTLREIWFRANLAHASCHICKSRMGEYHGTFCSADKCENPIDDRMASTFRAESLSKLLLGNGSLAVMAAGMQDTHEHRIPKSGLNVCGPRISLTFRKYIAV